MKRIWEREMWIVLGFLAGCFALGMAGGILFANLAYPCRNGQNQILELYALTQIKKKEGKSTEYFCYLLENRIFAGLFFILTGLCILSCSCTVDDKNLQRRGKYLEEAGKSNKNLFSDRSDRNDSVSFRCCF